MALSTPINLSSRVALVALAATLGCSANENSVYIRGIMAPTVNGNTCIYAAEPNGPRIFEGVLDLAFKRTYNLAPLMQSNVTARADPTSNRAESNHVLIEGYIVDIREDSPDGPALSGDFSNPFSVYQSSVVVPGNVGAAGFGVSSFEAIPLQIGQSLYNSVCVAGRGIRPSPGGASCVPIYDTNVTKRVILSVSAFGHTGGGVSVTTPKYNFPVTVCCGCLRFFPPNDMITATDSGPTLSVQRCVPVAAMGPALCNTVQGQDFPVPCGLCLQSNPFLCEPTGVCFRP
jgi:hypothetical protein